MAQSNPNLTDIFTDVADAIRAKTGSSSTMQPIDFADNITAIPAPAQLHAVITDIGTLTSSGDPFYIYRNADNGDFVTYYDIYKDATLVGSVAYSSSTISIDLRSYITVDGTYAITVKARGTGMTDSAASTSISYTHYTYQNVTNSLTNCTTDNAATEVKKGQSYSATLTTDAGYSFVGATIAIVMDGVDITSTAFNEGAISIANVTGDISISATYVAITQLAAPANVALSGDDLSWDAVANATSYKIYANGAYKATTNATSFDLSTLTFGASGTYAITVTACANGYSESNDSSSVNYSYSSPVDPILENNSWATIRSVCESGQAGDYWALGDSKNVTVGSYTRPVKIVHIGSIYTDKHAVFQFWYRTESNIVWDADNSNNVTTADIWASLASGGTAYAGLVDAELGAQLTDTTVQVATSGTDATLTTLTGKLFLPAEKELTATRAYSVSEEFAALTTFGYFAANDTNAARVRHKASAPEATSSQAYWTRSPYGGNSYRVVYVGSNGSISYDANDSSYGVAPCFAF